MREGYNHFKLTRGELAWAVGSRAEPLSVHGRQSSTSRVVGCGHLRSVSPVSRRILRQAQAHLARAAFHAEFQHAQVEFAILPVDLVFACLLSKTAPLIVQLNLPISLYSC